MRHYWIVSMAGGQVRAQGAGAPLSWRLYLRCLPLVVLALLVAAFSLGDRPAPMRSTLAPETFDGARAFESLEEMSAIAGAKGVEPGSSADRRLLSYIARSLKTIGGPDSGGYDVQKVNVQAHTSLGERRLAVLVARRAGASTKPPILLVAHRDTAGAGVRAQLSGDAALLEIAEVLASTETTRAVSIVFSDGGASGAAGTAAYLSSDLHRPIDAAIVLGALGGASPRAPLVQPFSSANGSAPELLARTVEAPLSAELHLRPRAPSFAAQLAHLIFPFAVGEQGLLGGHGIPAVAVDLAGEGGYGAGTQQVSEARLQQAGKAVLSAFYALDRGGQVSPASDTGLLIDSRTVPGWALQLLIGSLLLGPLAMALDALARLRRRKQPVARRLARSLACAVPVLAAATVVKLCGLAGVLSAAPEPARGAALSFGGGEIATLALALAALLACSGVWWRLRVQLCADGGQAAEGVALAALAEGCVLGVIVWIVNPYAALLIVPALHFSLLAISAIKRRAPRSRTLALVLAPAAVCVGLLLLYYALYLDFGALQLLSSALAIVAGGYVGFGAVLMWSIALGLLLAAAIAASSVRGVASHRSPLRGRGGRLAPREGVLRRVESDIFLGAGRR